MSVLLGKLAPIETGRLPGGLLSVARPLDAAFDTWRQGVNFNPLSGVDSQYYKTCIDPEDATDKTIYDVDSPLDFLPFLLYSGRQCSAFMDTADLLDMARRGLESTISGGFANQLQHDAANTGNPSLVNSAQVITGGPADVVNTISGLITAACDCGMNDLVFHVNIRLIPFLLERRLINWTGSHWQIGPWPVVTDCYSETDVPDGEDPLAEDGSESFIYVTGPIEVAVGPEYITEGRDVQTNGIIELVERLAILRFDANCVKAARTVIS